MHPAISCAIKWGAGLDHAWMQLLFGARAVVDAKQRNAQVLRMVGFRYHRASRPPLAGDERTLSDRIEVIDFVSARPDDATFGGPAWGMERFAPP
jgi:hypothetical protein